MKIDSPEDLFHHDLKDLYDAEHQIEEALGKMEKAAKSQDLKKAFREHRAQTQGQIKRLEKVFEEFGKKPSRKRCEGVSGLIEEGEEVINEIENPEVRDSALITAAQKVEHYEMAGYGSARSSAQLLGLRESPGLLQETLDEEGETDKKLIALAEKLNPKPLKSR